jgi:DNA-binding beta-propeller fold protein YncE
MPRRLASRCAALGAALAASVASAQPSFVAFESGSVRPLALSPDGTRLFAANTPAGTLELFQIGAGGIALEASVPVGLEPVTVAARGDDEVWVVNHLSDSVSIVDVAADPPRVVRTLLVGDEPRDLVFAGPDRDRAFVTTAHRGQQRMDAALAGVPGAGDPQLTTPGVGRADVWVFDAANPGASPGGVPIRIVTLFADTPRGLAVSPDGGTVYAAAFHSGNQTTVLSEGVVCDGFAAAPPCAVQDATVPGGNPGPSTNFAGANAPEVGLIVRWDGARWSDELDRDWSPAVRLELPDRDVFAIDATTLAQTQVWSQVGTTLFNLAVNPVTGRVYVSNTDSRNERRFEGPGVFGSTTVQGRLGQARISVLNGSAVLPRHLNKHIDYAARPAPPGVRAHSLATPTDLVVSPDGTRLYVAAFGSSKVGVFDVASLEADSFDPSLASAGHLAVSGGGPAGLALDAARDRLYVLTRFDNAVSVIDLATGTEASHVALPNPEPAELVDGRRFLYDAAHTSSNGEASCSSCHVFGDLDQLAWDLGNPDDVVTKNPIPINLGFAAQPGLNGTGVLTDFHPMKGPMTTQTLRGLVDAGAMHWRGDRAAPANGTVTPDPSDADERNAFENFNVAFPGLLGREAELPAAEMEAFARFALLLTLPPNPIRALDRSLTPAQQAGADFFSGERRSDGLAVDFGATRAGFTCEGCHTHDPAQGFFGTGGRASQEGETQILKIPHLRNLYQKVGMFGALDVSFIEPLELPHQGEQIRGFGFLHDGSMDTLFRFFHAVVFSNRNPLGLGEVGFPDDQTRRDVEQFMFAFDSDLAPVVGQQVTLDAENFGAAGPRAALLLARAAAPFTSKLLGGDVTECDLVAKGVTDGRARGWLRLASGAFEPDDGGPHVDAAALFATASGPGVALTLTCVPPGSGRRAGIDRDEDGVLDGVDRCPATPDATQADSDGDGIGDACDRCAVHADATQSDADADGMGDACDDRCGAADATQLAALLPATGPPGQNVEVIGSGIGPDAELQIAGISVAIEAIADRYLAKLPASLVPETRVRAVVFDPNGCTSPQSAVFDVTQPRGRGCGLLGIEAFLPVIAARALRRRLRRQRMRAGNAVGSAAPAPE